MYLEIEDPDDFTIGLLNKARRGNVLRHRWNPDLVILATKFHMSISGRDDYAAYIFQMQGWDLQNKSMMTSMWSFTTPEECLYAFNQEWELLSEAVNDE